MKKRFNKILKQARYVKLTDTEKADIKHVLISHIGGYKPEQEFSLFNSRVFRFGAVALSGFIVLGTGLSYAAENSLPGSPLYPIKTGVNESIGRVLAFGDKDEAAYEIMLAERRLREIEDLSANGKLTYDAAASLETKFTEHYTRAGKSIADNKDILDKAELISKLEISISTHAGILGRLSLEDGGENPLKISMLNALANNAAESRALREKTETELVSAGIISKNNVFAKLELAQKDAKELRKLVAPYIEKAPTVSQLKTENDNDEEIKVVAPTRENEAESALEAQLSEIDALLEQSRQNFENNSYNEAFIGLQQAERNLHRSRLLLNASGRFGINLWEFKNADNEEQNNKGEVEGANNENKVNNNTEKENSSNRTNKPNENNNPSNGTEQTIDDSNNSNESIEIKDIIENNILNL